MLIVKPVSAGVVRYFTSSGEPGRWTAGAALLGLSGMVEPGDLRSVLEGRHPATGQSLMERHPARQRAGWDLAFCAPKSFSLLAASGTPAGAAALEAHAAAVQAVASDLESRLGVQHADPPANQGAASRDRGAGYAARLVGASFAHALSAAGEPHLHTHLLVANLIVYRGRWRAVDPAPWVIDRRAMSALYHLALRHELAARGLHLQWRLRPDGLADLAVTGRETLRAASTQSRLVARLGRYEARRAAESSPARAPAERASTLPKGVWMAAEPLLPPAQASAGSLADPRLGRVVATRLAVRRSDFRQTDVLAALAACHPGGASPPEARAWVARFCEAALEVPSPTAGRRWTTPLARGADDQLAALLGRLPPVVPLDVDASIARTMADSSPAGWRTALRIVESPAPAHVLAAPAGLSGILGHAELLDACRVAWEAAGLRCAVWSPDGRGEARWRVLSGLAPNTGGERPDVLVVDQADRRSTGELLQAAAEVGRRAGRLVLVEGGTMPRLSSPASRGLYEAGAPRVWFSAPTPWIATLQVPVAGTATGREAAAWVLGEWLSSRLAGRRTAMVALGPEEVGALNEAARRALGLDAAGVDAVVARRGVLAPGDRVVALGGGRGLPPYATLGTVEGVGAATGSATIRWDGRDRAEAYGREALRGVAVAHALALGTAARAGVPAILLGNSEAGRELQLAAAIGPPARDGRALETGRGLDYG